MQGTVFARVRARAIAVAGFAALAALVLAAPAAADFEAAKVYPTGGEVYGVAVGDANRDGKVDIFAGNDSNDSGDHISYLRGRGNGKFRPEITIRDRRGPEGIVLTRISKDRRKDLVVAEFADGGNAAKLAFFLQNTKGKFIRKNRIDAGSGAWLLEAADINRDGKLDLVTGNYDPETPDLVSVHFGKGGGKFHARKDFNGPDGAQAVGLALGDVTGDNHRDVVVSDSTGSITVFAGKAGRSLDLAVSKDILGNSFGYQLALGRFNGDENLDIAVPDPVAPAIVLGLGDGDGFPEFLPAGTADAGSGIAAGDLSEDGFTDAAVGRESGGLDLAFGNGAGGFGFMSSTVTSVPTETVEIARLNKDPLPDIVAGTDTGVTVYINKPNS